MSRTILSSDETRLQLFVDHVAINKSLPKWRKAEAGLAKTTTNSFPDEYVIRQTRINGEGDVERGFFVTPEEASGSSNGDVDSDVDVTTKWLHLYQTPEGVDFDVLASAGIQDLARLMAENKLKYIWGGYGSFGKVAYNYAYDENATPLATFNNQSSNGRQRTWFKKIIDRLFYKEPTKPKVKEIDVIKFFSLVKATSAASAKNYRDLVSKYLIALHNAVDAGQTALQEDLIRGMVTNKYEAAMAANGLYYTITEEQMVNFVKKCEKGLSLCYLKNFARALPQYVVNKINEINNLEIFDNYVVLYYDADKDPYNASEKETAQEEAKRRDPILFGLLAGSNKLYYIADWIDEYCDLTLEKFVDTLGVDKETLNIYGMPTNIKKEETTTAASESKPKKKKRYYNKKKTKPNNI